ncbi:MAG: tRNA-guanosine(34) transglycosylase [Candidatus Babeliaceae bacterium]|nr:tRNA-guanosine(34) transglycosylase [Candidatus Babeliaceae bacterium]
MLKFEILHQSKKSRARVGRIHTNHGIVETPNFVPVATNASLKALTADQINALDIDLLFCNTYHLMLHPGEDVVAAGGGLHQFMNRTKPIITDSGGFQVFSLAYGGVHQELKSAGTKKTEGGVKKITEEGVLFRSYRDGSLIMLTPESSVRAQKKLGADIIIPLDELPPYHTQKADLKKSLDRTHRWEKRSLEEHLKNPHYQSMYAVVHGGIDQEMRKQSIDVLSKLAFDGYAIGGSLGKNRNEMVQMLTMLMPYMPYDKPNHLLGIADMPSLHAAIPLGLDTFDSSHPTKCARHGLLYTQAGNIAIVQGRYKQDFSAIDVSCDCYTCTHHSRAYVHHLFKAHELTAYGLATIHNVRFMVNLMKRYRQDILDNKL